MENEINNMTENEKRLFETLITLGDSKKMAVATVINERSKKDNSDFYKMAYEI